MITARHTLLYSKRLLHHLSDANQYQYVCNNVTPLKYNANVFFPIDHNVTTFFLCSYKRTISAAHFGFDTKRAMKNLNDIYI